MNQNAWSTGHFDATLLCGSLRVGHISASRIHECTHALVKLLVLDAEDLDASSNYIVSGGSSPALGTSNGKNVKGSSLDGMMIPSGFGELEIDDFEGLVGGPGVGHEENGVLNEPGVNIMLIQDLDGITVIVNERYYRQLQLCGVSQRMSWAPLQWRALSIHLGPASAGAPGIISYLSSMLSERKVSILNFSTFEADLILVQEPDLQKARNLLVECGRDGVGGLKEQIAEARRSSASNGNGSFSNGSVKEFAQAAEEQEQQQQQAQSPMRRRGKTRSASMSLDTIKSAALNVVQSPLVLACIQRVMLKQSMYSLMKQLMRNIDLEQSALRKTAIAANPNCSVDSDASSVAWEKENKHAPSLILKNGKGAENNLSKDYLWAYFSIGDEVSMLLDERDLIDFPEDSLVVCPQRWKAIRLVGKAITFDETGVVHVMSSPYDVGAQLLNMSTYSTNVTLVAEDEVQLAIDRLRQELNGNETIVHGSYLNQKENGAVAQQQQVHFAR